MASEKIETSAIRALTPWANNARTHSKKQVRQIAQSIETFGFTNPVLIDEPYDPRRAWSRGSSKVAGDERSAVFALRSYERSGKTRLCFGGQ